MQTKKGKIKMKVSNLVFTSVLLLGTVVLSETSFADVTYPQSAKTEGIVNFKDSDGTQTPVDPTDPEPGEVAPTPPNGTTGLLRLDQVPNLDFGTIEIKGQEVKAPASYVKLNNLEGELLYFVPAYFQVTDERGTNAGWTVTTGLTAFKAMDKTTGAPVAGVENLKGASITFDNGQLMNHSGLNDQEIAVLSPEVNNGITLVAEDGAPSQTMLSANVDEGMGVWTESFYVNDGSLSAPPTSQVAKSDESIELSVPGTARKSKEYNYVSTITWTLAATPEAVKGL
ncbi:hypothetical protein CBF35_06115 [Vagococcus salmoninarum]|uniref:WxL domain-containing protein n=2 Tax=Vagococcus salmoninarum TaxID=2739 RepID=A0A429ZS40_9ENTE|nr:hypothetical protein CBF35_06115 [Vagococcus salmoninarum]